MKKIYSEFYAKSIEVIQCQRKGNPPNHHVFVSFCLKFCSEKDCERKEKIKKEVGHGTE